MTTATQLRLQQSRRLPHGGAINRSQPIQFTYNGRTLQGYQGDTLASALMANGVDILGRSFKYSRPRGLMTAGIDEPNAIVQLGSNPGTQTPNVRATVQPLFEGLVCSSVNGWPSVENDAMSLVGKIGGEVMGPGFYYKTFMYPKSFWMTYEKVIRKAAGLGRSPRVGDAEKYDHMNHHADVTVVGAGPAGLCAALAAAQLGVDVLLIDAEAQAGGELLQRQSEQMIDNQAALVWVASMVAQLAALPNVTVLMNTLVNGCHDHNFLTAVESRHDHLPLAHRDGSARQRLHKIRSRELVLASGALERPLVFANNDVPGCLTAGAVVTYLRRYGVAPGQHLVVSTNNDSGYEAALAWHQAGLNVVAIADSRKTVTGDAYTAASNAGLQIMCGCAVIEAHGNKRVESVSVASINAAGTMVTGPVREMMCDTVATSGGYSPVVHLASHTGSRPVWNEAALGFVPGTTHEARHFCGSVNGDYELADCLSSGIASGHAAAMAYLRATSQDTTPTGAAATVPSCERATLTATQGLYLVPHIKTPSRAPKQFVDLQNDVTAAAIQMATREGFENIEHVKRGAHVGSLFDPKRFTAMHRWHLERGAEFEDVGQWKRPWFFPIGNETMDQAVQRECQATRESVGILDASTLGKIDIQGPDAREFLGRVYTNAWEKLAPGRCRYGLMCGEDGMVFDDGVTACLSDQHFQRFIIKPIGLNWMCFLIVSPITGRP